jgi:DNA-binding MarR family transcriptional regulator
MATDIPVTPAPDTTIKDDVAEFAALLNTTTRALMRAGPPPAELRGVALQASLGKRHLPALVTVAAKGPLSVSDLATRLGLLLSTTSTIVGQLNRAGLVRRTEDEHDRRRTIVELHPDYRDPVDAWFRGAMRPVRETFELLSPEAREQFMATWRTLHEHATCPGSPVDESELELECDA